MKSLKKSIITIFLIGVLSINASANSIEFSQFIDSDEPSDTFYLNYRIVDTGQVNCYDSNGQERICSSQEAFFNGQDARHMGHQPDYTKNDDGTVSDNITGLMWQQSPDTDGNGEINADDRLSYYDAMAGAEFLDLGGYTDWRLPTIKELYSLISFDDSYNRPDSFTPCPFINNVCFDFDYGGKNAEESIIDTPYASMTLAGTETNGFTNMFGVNFTHGCIYGYAVSKPDSDRTFFVRYVRGNIAYGHNNFADNQDGTITDHATGLMWARDDSATELCWEEALVFVQQSNDESYLSYTDWRLPNIKELQSIVDYTRSPDITGSAAIDQLFYATPVVNEAGQTDYPYYWSSTTYPNLEADLTGANAAYIAFGRAMGLVDDSWVDVHGAGAQRSDPKTGDPEALSANSQTGYNAVRIYNACRLVRDIN